MQHITSFKHVITEQIYLLWMYCFFHSYISQNTSDPFTQLTNACSLDEALIKDPWLINIWWVNTDSLQTSNHELIGDSLVQKDDHLSKSLSISHTNIKIENKTPYMAVLEVEFVYYLHLFAKTGQPLLAFKPIIQTISSHLPPFNQERSK